MKSHLSFTDSISCLTGVLSGKSLLKLISRLVPYAPSPKLFRVQGLSLRPFDLCVIIFLKRIRDKDQIPFFYMWKSLFLRGICWRFSSLFTDVYSWHICKKEKKIRCLYELGLLCGSLILFHWQMYLVLCQYHTNFLLCLCSIS